MRLDIYRIETPRRAEAFLKAEVLSRFLRQTTKIGEIEPNSVNIFLKGYRWAYLGA